MTVLLLILILAPLSPRRHGFGKTNPNLKISHDSPLVYFILHLSWDFLQPEEWYQLSDGMPVFLAYAKLRRSVATTCIQPLRLPRQPIGIEKGLMHERAWQAAVALLLHFDFHYSDLLCWMEGKFTTAHCNWSSVSDAINAVHDIEPPDGYPQVDFDRAFWACTDWVPLACDHHCSFESVSQLNLYDNQPDLEKVTDEVRARFAKEEAQSFHIAFPRFIWRFIVGLNLAALVWAICKLKGQLCVNPSSTFSSVDDGAANARIPKPGTTSREDECPPIFYSNALTCHLTWIWRLQLMWPSEDIIQYVDGIQAAFHQVLYHPDAGIMFASVFCEFLVIIPIGTIFGARNSPSFFTLPSELRAQSFLPNLLPSVLTHIHYKKVQSISQRSPVQWKVETRWVVASRGFPHLFKEGRYSLTTMVDCCLIEYPFTDIAPNTM